MKLPIAVVFALAATAVQGGCPNSCSGHGNCDEQQQCTCYLEGKVLNKEGNLDTDTRLAQWTGADCSQLTCPRGISWTHASGTQDHAHGAECSDLGVCNRLTGECVCHPGFGGIACARSDCPNDCNGHGMCRSNRHFAEKYARAMSTASNLNFFLPRCTGAAGSGDQYTEENCAREIEHIDNYFNTYMATYEDAWDSNLQWGCDCDMGFFGPDCSLRECPSNYDPLDGVCNGLLTDADDLSVVDSVTGETVVLSTTDEELVAETFGAAYADYVAQFRETHLLVDNKGGFKATFKHFPDFSRAMHPIHFPHNDSTGTANNDTVWLQNAVDEGHYILPISPDQVNLKNRYEPIAVRTAYCAGRLVAVECSGRGLCDHATGLCQCFPGYMTEDCSEPEELV